ncbi:hypothetical protein CsSME_00042781 [Camellia sinensis var. sinensis]
MRKKNSENMRKKEYISVIFKTSYFTRPNDTPYIGDITNIIITHYMPLTYYILPLSTTIIFYTCHYLPPTPLSYSIHATIYHQHHYHILCINTNFQHIYFWSSSHCPPRVCGGVGGHPHVGVWITAN